MAHSTPPTDRPNERSGLAGPLVFFAFFVIFAILPGAAGWSSQWYIERPVPLTSSIPPPIRVARIITRLNIGGPSIQAAELTSRLSPRGFDTLLVHGSVDAQE